MFCYRLMNLVSLLFLANCFQTQQTFRCPQLSKLTTNESDVDGVDSNEICLCLNKQHKIICRLRNYQLNTFPLVRRYFKNIEKGLWYQTRHLRHFIFNLCINTNYQNGNGSIPRITIDFDLTSRIQFDTIIITFCEQRYTKPIMIDLHPHFLALHAMTLLRLEIEITSTNDDQVEQLLTNLAHSIIGLQRLKQLIIWMGEHLKLKISQYLFASNSPLNYFVPLEEIVFIDDHLKEFDDKDEIVKSDQILIIESYGFKYLRRLKLLSFQNVYVKSIKKFSFVLPDNKIDKLTINFTSDNLQKTHIDSKAFLNIGRPTTIYFNYYNQHQIDSKNVFIPTINIFREFLMENSNNKIVFGYTIDCKADENIQKIQWILESKELLKNQIDLHCDDLRNVFDHKLV